MAKYYFRQAVKLTTWREYPIEIEADSQEEAENILIKCFGDIEASDADYDPDVADVGVSELQYELEEQMTIEQNDGAATVELYNKTQSDPFWMNV